MVDPTKHRGDSGRPYGPEPEKKDEKIDPEKFKKVMKIDQTDESQKRHQRRLRKEEEEGDEEDDQIQTPSPPTPVSSFAEFMKDEDDLNSVFEKQSSGVQKRAAPSAKETPPPPSSLYSPPIEDESYEEEIAFEEPPPVEEESSSISYEEETPFSTSEQETFSTPYTYEEETPYLNSDEASIPEDTSETFYSPSIPSEESDTSDFYPSDEDTSSSPQPYSEQKTEKESVTSKDQKKKDQDISLLSSQVKKGALTPKKPKKSAPGPTIETTPSLEKQALSKETDQEKTDQQKEEKKTLEDKQALSPEKQEEKKAEGQTSPVSIPSDISLESTISPSPLEKEEKKKLEQSEMVASKKAPSAFKRFSPEDIQKQHLGKLKTTDLDQASLEGMVPLTPLETELGMQRKKKGQKEDFPFIDSASLMMPFATSESTFSPIKAPETISSYFRLNPQVRALYNQMVGSVIIQEHKGITSTIITINRPDSIFNGAKITLDRYSTAPNAYNLQLTANPAAVDLFNQNLGDLVAAFKQGQHAFEVNILKPAYESKKPLIRRKGAAGEDKGKGKG